MWRRVEIVVAVVVAVLPWPSKKGSEHVAFVTFLLQNGLRATTACTFWMSQLPGVVRDCQLSIWLNASTSQTVSNVVCFAHFYFEMCCADFAFEICLAPKHGALPKALQSWGVFDIFTSEPASATAACTFSTFELPRVLRHCSGAFDILTSKSASRDNGPPLLLHLSTLSEVWLLIFFAYFYLFFLKDYWSPNNAGKDSHGYALVMPSRYAVRYTLASGSWWSCLANWHLAFWLVFRWGDSREKP